MITSERDQRWRVLSSLKAPARLRLATVDSWLSVEIEKLVIVSYIDLKIETVF